MKFWKWLFGKKEPVADVIPVTGIREMGQPTSQNDIDRLIANYSRRADQCLAEIIKWEERKVNGWPQMTLTEMRGKIKAIKETRKTFLNEIETLRN